MLRAIPLAIAVSTAIALSSCGGGNSGTTPATRTPANGAATPAPSASQRTSVGTAHLTLVLPNAIRASSAKLIHATKTSSTARRPQFVDPQPNPNISSSPFSAPVLDIYVDGTLIPNIDGVAGSNDSFVVTSASGDGTQSFSLPLYSLANNIIVAVEYDQTRTNVLAIGETNLNGDFTPGGTTNVPLTMTMNATDIGVVDLPNESNAMLISTGGSSVFGSFSCAAPPSSTGFAFFALDANQAGIVDTNAVNGAGSPPIPFLQSVISAGGSHLANGSLPGEYSLVYAGCSFPSDSLAVSVAITNPAYSIFSDVEFNGSYFSGWQNGTVNGDNQGIYNLWQQGTLNIFSFSTQTQSRLVTFQDET